MLDLDEPVLGTAVLAVDGLRANAKGGVEDAVAVGVPRFPAISAFAPGHLT